MSLTIALQTAYHRVKHKRKVQTTWLSRTHHRLYDTLLTVRHITDCTTCQCPITLNGAQNGSQEVVKLWGEDALLSWPGAMDVVINDRDAYMAKAIWAAATGQLPSRVLELLCLAELWHLPLASS